MQVTSVQLRDVCVACKFFNKVRSGGCVKYNHTKDRYAVGGYMTDLRG